MFDIITHVPDSLAYLKEVESKFPSLIIRDINGDAVKVSITKTPTARKAAGTASISLLRASTAELASLKKLISISILAEVVAYGDILAVMTAPNRKIYDSIHDQTPIAIFDRTGKQVGIQEVDPLIGRFM